MLPVLSRQGCACYRDVRWPGGSVTLVFVLQCDTKDCCLLFQPVLDDFHQAFEVVFVDPSGLVNLCADMTASKYHQVLGRLWWLLEMLS